MKKIYKYKLGIDGNEVTIKGQFSRIVKIMMQFNWPTIWMEVDDDYDEVEVKISCIGTNWPYTPELGTYVDSVIDTEDYVWHYFTDTVVFLSKEEKEQMEQYQEMMGKLFNGGFADNGSGILTKEPTIDLI